MATTDSKGLINQTEVTQPLLLLSHYLHFKTKGYDQKLNSHDFMIGHSLGEYSALVNSRSITLAEGLKLVHQRGRLMKEVTKSPHGMLVVRTSPDQKAAIQDAVTKKGLEIACYNSPTSVVVAGLKDQINELSAELKTQKIISRALAVSTAFHCRNLEAMASEFQQLLAKTNFWLPKCKLLRNFDAKPYRSAGQIRQGLLNQLTNPVLFEQSVRQVPKEVKLVEVGHKATLTSNVEETRATMKDDVKQAKFDFVFMHA